MPLARARSRILRRCHRHGGHTDIDDDDDDGLGTALNVDVQLIAQTVIYYSIVLFGLLISVPVGLTTANFKGFCIMYGEVVSDRINFGATTHCMFVTYMHVATSVIYAFVQAICHTIATVQSIRGRPLGFLSNQLSVLTILGFNSFITFLSLIAACIISVGFSRWCNSLLVNAHYNHHYRLETCSEAEQLEWQNVDGSTFHSCYSLATAGAWLCLFSWLVQTALSILVFLRFKEEELGIARLEEEVSITHALSVPTDDDGLERY